MRTFALFLALTLVPIAALAAPNPPPAPIITLTDAILHAADTDDASGLAGIFTGDATVVDENAPFVWRGSSAGTAWWSVVRTVIHKAKLTRFKVVNVRVGEFVQTPTDAYLIQTMTITAATPTKPFGESGTMTYTFHKTGETWKISTMVWTTKP